MVATPHPSGKDRGAVLTQRGQGHGQVLAAHRVEVEVDPVRSQGAELGRKDRPVGP